VTLGAALSLSVPAVYDGAPRDEWDANSHVR
jgi:hypothetical protein